LLSTFRPEICCHLKNEKSGIINPAVKKRIQTDCNLGFVLAIVDQIEEGG
jgi:hypothetical protein